MVRSILNIPDEKLRSLDKQDQLTAYDRNILKDVIEVLTPCESATHCVQSDRVVTGSMAVPCVRILKAELEALYNQFSSKFVLAKNFMHKRLTKYEDYKAFQTASVAESCHIAKAAQLFRTQQLQKSSLHLKSAAASSVP